jgi:hypothetical protein
MADAGSTTSDASLSLELSTVKRVGRDTNQSCDLFTAHGAELRQERNQGAGQDRSDIRHRGEQLIAMSKCAVGDNDLHQMLTLVAASCLARAPSKGREQNSERNNHHNVE